MPSEDEASTASTATLPAAQAEMLGLLKKKITQVVQNLYKTPEDDSDGGAFISEMEYCSWKIWKYLIKQNVSEELYKMIKS